MFGRQTNDAGGIAGLGTLQEATHGAGVPGSSTGGGASAVRMLRVVAGWALLLGCLGYAGSALYELMSYGTCASGGPYVSARECAPGTGLKIVGITLSVFGVLLAMALIGSFRGALATWGLTFGGLGSLFLYLGFGPDSTGAQSEQLFGAAMGGMFLLMGLPGLVLALLPRSSRERRQVSVQGPYGTELSVDAQEDGGPAPVVMANLGGVQPPRWPPRP